jgi:acetyl-CoA carboxylase carboxyl transferase subunit beta|tara:strand:- start:500 stop:1441 length:942 start_codon:yes stop_codon:yes gene_type:complete
MNWITRLRKFGDNIKRVVHERIKKNEINSAGFVSCCRGPILETSLKENYYQCPDCSKTFPISPSLRFSYLWPNKNFELIDCPVAASEDILKWEDATGKFSDKLKKVQKKYKTKSALQVAQGILFDDISVVVVASEFGYLGSSIGPSEGESLLAACAKSIETNAPLIIFAQGGGMRLQNSPISLVQMNRSVMGLNEVKRQNIPTIVIADSVVAGGISASYAAAADFLIFEGKKTRFMFAGPRVAANVEKGNLPDGFLEATYCVEHGFGDFIIENRKDTRKKLITLLSILLKKNSAINSLKNETKESNTTLTKAS